MEPVSARAMSLLPHHVADSDERGEDHGAEDIEALDEGHPGAEPMRRTAARRQEAVGEDDDEHDSGSEANGGGDVDELAHDWRHEAPPCFVCARSPPRGMPLSTD